MTKQPRLTDRIFELLLTNPQGLSVHDICEHVGSSYDVVQNMLYRTYGFYIARWDHQSTGKAFLRAIWRCVAVPPNARKPLRQAEGDETREEVKQRDQIKREKIALRERQERINKRLKAERDAARVAANEIKKQMKLEREQLREEARRSRVAEKIKKPAYVPEKTVWQPVKPWPKNEGARA